MSQGAVEGCGLYCSCCSVGLNSGCSWKWYLGVLTMGLTPEAPNTSNSVRCLRRRLHRTFYETIEREALSLIFGIQKFHKYVYGLNVTLISDHKPPTTTLAPKKCIPLLAMVRLQRWAMQLAAHDYDIQYKPWPWQSRLSFKIAFDLGSSCAQ